MSIAALKSRRNTIWKTFLVRRPLTRQCSRRAEYLLYRHEDLKSVGEEKREEECRDGCEMLVRSERGVVHPSCDDRNERGNDRSLDKHDRKERELEEEIRKYSLALTTDLVGSGKALEEVLDQEPRSNRALARRPLRRWCIFRTPPLDKGCLSCLAVAGMERGGRNDLGQVKQLVPLVVILGTVGGSERVVVVGM